MTIELTSAARTVADEVMAALAGPGARLRPDQEEAVAALVRGGDTGARVLLVQATGWGKSAVYWVATAVLRAAGGGPTLVVSPLISLMRDQVAAATRAGLRAETIHSGNITEWTRIEEELLAGALDVVLVSPERLANPTFGRRVMSSLAGRLGLLVIDEAHSVSDWGHDFRPDYRRVSDVLRDLNPQAPVLATTATANSRVTADVAAQLGEGAMVLRGRLGRASLRLTVLPELTPIQRYAWVIDMLPRLPGSGIVYALTVADAERLTEVAREILGDDLPVASYTGGLEPDLRARLEDDLRANRVKALIATSALGMGFDKPDLGFVVHVGSPPSPVSYYQQIGRAGRGIDHAEVVLLPSRSDAGVWDYFATATLPDPPQVQAVLTGLADLTGPTGSPASVPALEAATGVRRGRVELYLKQLSVDGVVDRVPDGWVPTGKDWVYDADHYGGILAVRQAEAEIMRRYAAGDECLMLLLQRVLDDPTAGVCGRCSVCRGGVPETMPAEPAQTTVAAVEARLRRTVQELPPRKMWPGGAFGRGGRIAAGELAEPGRVLIHADAPEWQSVLARLGQVADPADVPQPLLEAGVATLVGWRATWAHRPDLVLWLDAAGLPLVAETVAAHLGSVGRLPVRRLSRRGSPPPGRETTSADEARYWSEELVGMDEGVEGVVVSGAWILLVVDASSSQWPITVAAARLRSVGAAGVLPLLVHRRP